LDPSRDYDTGRGHSAILHGAGVHHRSQAPSASLDEPLLGDDT